MSKKKKKQNLTKIEPPHDHFPPEETATITVLKETKKQFDKCCNIVFNGEDQTMKRLIYTFLAIHYA